ncbi:MAG: 1-acyl-sn-glycerol-3-phosphate acyltransferase [Bacteroidetes bacterium QS_9_68_14]|nr:MAG: 1-acyl-sn-glycerol-3-phosphate acyltransferase [Bacteroidetes bacterium QS_9_68_14]
MPAPERGDTIFARTLSDEDERARRVEGVPEPTLWTRLHFAWAVAWFSLATIPFSLVQMVTHRLWPTAANFKRWSGRWARVILGGMGIELDVDDRAGLAADEACVFVVNHQNLLDIFTTAAAIPYPFAYLAKKELTRVPFLSLALRHSPSLFLDRSSRRAAMRCLAEGAGRLRDGQSVLVFAEGSRSYSPVVYPFKRGAFRVAAKAGVPVVPVTIRDSYRVMDERRYASRPGTLSLVIGEPVATEEGADAPAAMAAARKQMERALAEERRRCGVEEGGEEIAARGTGPSDEP